MRELGIAGVVRGRSRRTTVPAAAAERSGDLVRRSFEAPAPNRTWVADITYCRTQAGFAYVAFVVDVFARVVVGWAVSASLRADLALAALEMAFFSRRTSPGVARTSPRSSTTQIKPRFRLSRGFADAPCQGGVADRLVGLTIVADARRHRRCPTFSEPHYA